MGYRQNTDLFSLFPLPITHYPFSLKFNGRTYNITYMPLSGKTLKLIGPLLWDADHARVDLRKDKRADQIERNTCFYQ